MSHRVDRYTARCENSVPLSSRPSEPHSGPAALHPYALENARWGPRRSAAKPTTPTSQGIGIARAGPWLVRLIVFAGCVVAAGVAGSRVAGAQGTPAIDRPMPYMQAMNRILRVLQQQVKDPSQNRSTLSLVADLEWSTLSAKEAVPLRSTILPDVERQAMLVGYRRLFLKLLR